MTKISALLLTAAIALASPASAATLTWGTHNTPYEYSGRTTNWDENIESESTGVTKSGVWTNYNVAAVPWGQGTWLFTAGSYVEVAFSAAADTLFAQFQSDGNDGTAEFWVDGALVGSIDTLNIGWFQAKISGLTVGQHTMRIYSRRNNAGQDDLAFDNFGALASTAVVPLPAGFPLLLAGLGGLAALRRRSRHG